MEITINPYLGSFCIFSFPSFTLQDNYIILTLFRATLEDNTERKKKPDFAADTQLENTLLVK